MGGKLRIVVVGGAPLSETTHSRMRALFGCTIQVGYGATETCACISGTLPCDLRTGLCGGPCHGVLVNLADWGEYRITDKPYPRGEVLVGGPNVVNGYFLRPEKTKEAFFEMDGVRWFKTGDIAEIDDTGAIRIIDRIGDIIKLDNGEYIALGKIEMYLKEHPVIENLFVNAKAGARGCVCIAVSQ
ncbi:long-chain-fatty-acid--CoA ligase 4-like [Penaeus monodon]|uniref:long-chain-fatty-acid--CoA ligase 4-like n=1 Tax=Penaeus monodon TaxID=6687 RepID=UPI0018A78898|nr:long-chain-fatty-acid--CoA ligase 4-like [Penaeus monodon]